MKLHTRVLTSGQSLLIDGAWNVLQISAMVSVDTGDNSTVLGNLSIGGTPSAAVPVPAGAGLTLTGALPNAPIQGVTFTCVQGTLSLIMGVQ